MTKRSRLRWVWWACAYLALGLGIVGVVLPLVPTTPFILLAAFCAARGSDELHRRLLAHRIFGPMITDWQANGAVSRRAKYLALGSMAVCAVVLFLVTPMWWTAALGTACMAAVGTWLWFRPEPAEAPAAATGTADDSDGERSVSRPAR